ncbi:hypothetical protein ACFXAZ_05670 [Streptomyces sp. NPDC059477]|uniref:hypothetical protein n=1 Tax=Streptomyces sp. NPDC059477 TaxID=3346847 RepID=UPI0036845138
MLLGLTPTVPQAAALPGSSVAAEGMAGQSDEATQALAQASAVRTARWPGSRTVSGSPCAGRQPCPSRSWTA